LDAKTTRFGTKFTSEVDLTNKRLGIGVVNGFIGGSGFSYGTALAAFTVYHRYLKYKEHASPSEFDETYYNAFYRQNQCQHGCPPSSHCQWGLCECDPGYHKSWGLCRDMQLEDVSWLEGEPGSRKEGAPCSEQSQCNRIDINLVCTESVDGTHSCSCRRDMAWNSRTLECQMFLDVDCRDLKYTYAPTKEIDTAAQRLEHKLRGWTTEEDRVEKVFGLQWVREQMHAACDLYNNTSVENYYIRAYEKGHLCPPNNIRSRTQKEREFYHKYNKRCKVDQLMQDMFAFNVSAIPTDRTQTPEEALELSILSTLITTSTNASLNLSTHKHEEALCRDLEAFSPAFALRVAEERPAHQGWIKSYLNNEFSPIP